LTSQLNLSTNNGGVLQLQKIFPKTLNASVSTTVNADNGTSTNQSQQNTSGSSHTNVNTFGVGLQLGMFGPLPMGTLSADYSHSWEHTVMDSGTTGTGSSASHGTGSSASMSIKDWSAYGALDATSVNPTWIFGQSYPWDVIQYNQSSNGSQINLPEFVQAQLLNGTLVLPPSQLAQFGLDFTTVGNWLIDFPQGITSDETITIDHRISSFTASHSLVGSAISANLQTSAAASQAQFSSGAIDLSSYSLIPLSGAATANGSAIGFAATPFTMAPTSALGAFKISSPANTLQITGSGFDSGMSTAFAQPVSATLTFKIADYNQQYSLLLMHWIGAGSGAVKIAWTVNGQWSGVMFVDAQEGSGGQGNVSSIELRNTDFTSIHFHDYLVVGTNTISLVVTPVDSTPAQYTWFAAAIGQA
jgi:hypothetical protein